MSFGQSQGHRTVRNIEKSVIGSLNLKDQIGALCQGIDQDCTCFSGNIVETSKRWGGVYLVLSGPEDTILNCQGIDQDCTCFSGNTEENSKRWSGTWMWFFFWAFFSYHFELNWTEWQPMMGIIHIYKLWSNCNSLRTRHTSHWSVSCLIQSLMPGVTHQWLICLTFQEFQRRLGSKQPVYDGVNKAGRTLKDRCPSDDMPTIQAMLTELKSRWNSVCSKSVDR